MAGYVPNEYRAVLLEALVGRTTITLGTTYLGLAFSLPADPLASTLATITEVNTAGYARKATNAGGAWPAASVVAPIQIVQTNAFTFVALSADMAQPAYFAFLTDASSGTAGKIRYIFELADPVQGRNGEAISVPARALIIE